MQWMPIGNQADVFRQRFRNFHVEDDLRMRFLRENEAGEQHERSICPYDRSLLINDAETVAGEVQSAGTVVVATPAYATAAIVKGIDAELARLCGEIPYASAATVALAFPRSP